MRVHTAMASFSIAIIRSVSLKAGIMTDSRTGFLFEGTFEFSIASAVVKFASRFHKIYGHAINMMINGAIKRRAVSYQMVIIVNE